MVLLNSILTIAAVGLILIQFVLPTEIYANFLKIQIISLIILVPTVICNWIFLIKKKKLKFFLSLTIFIAIISGFLTPYVYEFIYSFGQNDLMEYAKFARKNNYTISTYLTGRKYSLLYYGNQSQIDFQTEEDLDWLNNELKKEKNLLIIRNKDVEGLDVKIKQKGVKYSLIERGQNEK